MRDYLVVKDEIKGFIEILSQAEAFRPLVKAALGAVKSYGPEIEEIPKKFSKWLVKNRIEAVKMYEDAGFTREDAITMTLDDVWAVRKVGQSLKNKQD